MKNHVFKKLRLLTYAFTGCICLVILSSGTAWAVWCATSECSSCGSNNWSKREECRFDSQPACNNEIARVQREMNIYAAKFSCYEKGSGNPSTTSGDPMAGAIMGALTGNRQQFSIGLGGLLGQALGNALRGNPEEDARRRAAEQVAERHRAEQEAQRRAEQEARAAEQKRIAEEQERLAEATKQRLQGELIGVDASPQLALMRIDSSSNSNLQLMVEPNLKDALNDNPGLHGSQPSTIAGQGDQATAWQQLHCARYISGNALGALDKRGDYQTYGALSVEALEALDGQRPAGGMECPAAPPMPNLQGRSVDLEQLKDEERKILDRAAVIAERMKQAKARLLEVKPSVPDPVPANETEMEKQVRLQKKLNRENDRKLYGEQKEIYEQEKNRKEVTTLILEKEQWASVVFGTEGEVPLPVPRPSWRNPPDEPPSPEVSK